MQDADGDTQIQVEESSDEDKIRFDTGGTERMIIDSTGVGIGTGSPANKLAVNGGLSVEGAAAAGISEGLLIDYSTNLARFLTYDSSTGSEIAFYTQPSGGSTAERVRIDSSGNVGIGTTATDGMLTIKKTGSNIFGDSAITIQSADTNQSTLALGLTGSVAYVDSTESGSGTVLPLVFATGSTEKMRIESAGTVKISHADTASEGFRVIQTTAARTSGGSLVRIYDDQAGTTQPTLVVQQNGTGDILQLFDGASQVVTVKDGGNVGIGTTNPVSITGAAGPILDMQGPNPEIVFHDNNGTANSMSMYYINDNLVWYGNSSENLRLTNAGDLTVAGALSKGSGSFKIDHPLPAKTETHNLVHSFIEGPQADNIYRGKVDLVAGSATVNIDTVAGMTEGTFVLLNTNISCFTSNESGWDAVKGSVSGNILTISCQNTSSTATVSWLVIGERHDQHMIDTDWTDENGKVIVEPLK
jgi:hypothetical protein